MHRGCLPAGDGDLFAFQNLVARLDPDRPVFGLRPPRTEDVPGLRGKSVPWLAARYVDELVEVQPTGPYRLAGYSAGGIIAVEMARGLRRRGSAVDLLMILDSPPHVAWWVGALHTGLCRACKLLGLRWLAHRSNSRWLKRRLHAILDEGLRTHVAVTRSHQVAPYPGRITYFQPRSSWVRLLDLAIIGRSWRKIAEEGLEVRRVPGTHYGMFRGRNLGQLAAALNGCLREAG